MDDSATTMPCSSAQQRMWFHEQLAPDSAMYNVHVGMRLTGALDTRAFENSIGELVARHEILRTSLRAIEGVPYQVIHEEMVVRTPVTDLSELPRAAAAAEVRDLAAEHAAKPFRIHSGPLLRSGLIRIEVDEHVWLLTLHHAICDGESISQLLRELSDSYRRAVRGTAEEVATPQLQYADYAAWQQEELTSGRLNRTAARCATALADAPALMALPADRPRPPQPSFSGALERLPLGREVQAAVQTLAARVGATQFQVLLTAVLTMLHRLTGQDDLVVGLAVDARSRLEFEPVIGCFVNTVPVRVHMTADDPFEVVVARVRRQVIEAQSHAEVPFEELVRRLAPRREASHHPVFQVMVDDQASRSEALTLPDIVVTEQVLTKRDTSLFDLEFSFTITDDAMHVTAEYATDLFDSGTVRALLEVLDPLLQAARNDPATSLGRLPLTTTSHPGTPPQIAVRAAETSDPLSIPRAVHRAAAASPDAVAVVEMGSQNVLTYANLMRWTERLRQDLAHRSVGPGDRVALLLERSAAAVVAQLSVMAAGAAYVPMSPQTPAQRREQLLAEIRPRVVIANDASLGEPGGWSVLGPGAPETDGSTDTVPALDCRADPDSAAYVMFTSGSTGTPKGVVVTHTGILHHAQADIGVLGLGPSDRVLQFSDLTFDLAAEEIYPCLTSGATLVIRSPAMIDSAAGFLRECEAHRISVAHLPTSYFHELAAEVATGISVSPSLRAVVIGGEAVTPGRLRQWQAGAPAAFVFNAYGPTETTIAVTLTQLVGPSADEGGDVVLGRALPGNSLLVLDSELRPLPPGFVGELYAEGPGVAHGYLNRSDLTAERFVPAPNSGGRMFRTGDLVRSTADGCLTFCGRADRQLKVRGFRIEPGEVEDALCRHPQVARAAVTGWQRDDVVELVAYVETHERTGDLEAGLRRHLSDLLPRYAVPTRFAFLERLPLTRSEKVDYARLPAQLPTDPPERVPASPPTGRTEQLLARIWEEVLGQASVRRDDDFFGLGGHSLLATRVISRLARRHGLHLGLADIFRHPRLADQAARVDERQQAGAARPQPQRQEPALRRASAADELSALAELRWH